MGLTKTEENYIKAIFKQSDKNAFISTNELAAAINIKAPSVTDMLKKLKVKKVITYKPYEGCKLTAEGVKMAVMIIRKHRLWETFLCTKLGFSWDAVHDIAEELEHIGNMDLINRLDAFLDYPETDPHGDFIPDKNGVMKKHSIEKLSTKNIGNECKVYAVDSHEKGILELLNHYEIKLGSTIQIIKKFDYDESLEVLVNQQHKCVLPNAITNNILVA
jgi:DtxR family transcriptional regulator, Mn-dependent transcriptional regulator